MSTSSDTIKVKNFGDRFFANPGNTIIEDERESWKKIRASPKFRFIFEQLLRHYNPLMAKACIPPPEYEKEDHKYFYLLLWLSIVIHWAKINMTMTEKYETNETSIEILERGKQALKVIEKCIEVMDDNNIWNLGYIGKDSPAITEHSGTEIRKETTSRLDEIRDAIEEDIKLKK